MRFKVFVQNPLVLRCGPQIAGLKAAGAKFWEPLVNVVSPQKLLLFLLFQVRRGLGTRGLSMSIRAPCSFHLKCRSSSRLPLRASKRSPLQSSLICTVERKSHSCNFPAPAHGLEMHPRAPLVPQPASPRLSVLSSLVADRVRPIAAITVQAASASLASRAETRPSAVRAVGPGIP